MLEILEREWRVITDNSQMYRTKYTSISLIAEDQEVDGIIHDKDTGQWFFVEHVSALKTPGSHAVLKGENRVLHAIQIKINLGKEYAQGKRLVVFIEDAGLWYPDRVGLNIDSRHYFDAVYVIGLESSETDYVYSVS